MAAAIQDNDGRLKKLPCGAKKLDPDNGPALARMLYTASSGQVGDTSVAREALRRYEALTPRSIDAAMQYAPVTKDTVAHGTGHRIFPLSANKTARAETKLFTNFLKETSHEG
jgi:hypothetical protein